MREQVTKSIIVNGEAPDLYATWMDFRNHPHFKVATILLTG